jgi:SSS family solute:Na+ symporter
MHLSWFDYAIVILYVGATVFAGMRARAKIKNISDFLVAGRGLKTHMAVATMVSTGLGLVTVMYMAEEGFKYGFVPFVFGIMAFITSIIIGRTGFIVSRLRHLQVMTVPEFYELKFSRGVRILGGIILMIAGTLNMGLFPILGSKFIVGFTGLDKEYVNYVMVLMLVIVVVYTLLGGMISVVLTDFAQFILLSLGFIAGTYLIMTHPQLGWDNMVLAVQTHKGDLGFDPISNPGY